MFDWSSTLNNGSFNIYDVVRRNALLENNIYIFFLKYTITVNSPANAIIGKYQLSVITGRGVVYMAGDCPIYILFNPWCEGKTFTSWMSEYNSRLYIGAPY